MNSFSNCLNACNGGRFSKQVSEKSDTPVGDSSQQLSEKIETETEDGFELEALVLPFLVAYFRIETPRFLYSTATPLAEQLTNQIYISVHNLRI